MKIRHFDTKAAEESIIQAKEQKENKLFYGVSFTSIILLIAGIVVISMLKKVQILIEIVQNSGKDDFIFICVFVIICLIITTMIYLIFHRKKKGEKFCLSDFRISVTAALGIMLICGILFMCIMPLLS